MPTLLYLYIVSTHAPRSTWSPLNVIFLDVNSICAVRCVRERIAGAPSVVGVALCGACFPSGGAGCGRLALPSRLLAAACHGRGLHPLVSQGIARL